MNGFKLIKTTFENCKEIIGVHFNGEDNYNLFVTEVRKVFNIPIYSQVQVFTKDFFVKPEIFSDLVAQYICSIDFVLDIKLAYDACSSSSIAASEMGYVSEEEYKVFSPNITIIKEEPDCFEQIPSTETIRNIREIQDILQVPVLEKQHQGKIAKTLISYMLKDDPDRKLLRDEFLQLSQSIVDIFPSEVMDTYYIPFIKGHLAKGKLVDAYNTARKRLKAEGLIYTRGIPKPEEFHSTASNSAFDDVCTQDSSTYMQLPSTEEIKLIDEFQNCLKLRVLENKHRTKLAKALILYVLKCEPDKRLLRDDFLQLAQSIVEIFPFEVKETYYVPFKNGHIAKGKLFDAYNNTRSRLKAAGLIYRRVKSKSDETPSSPSSPSCSILNESELNNLTQGTIIYTIQNLLPSTEDIKNIPEFQNALQLNMLVNNHRTKIAKALISYVLKDDPDKKLIREDFLQLAQSIIDIFPAEVKETYYVPFHKGHLAKGKLVDAYHNIRARLKDAGLINRRVKSKSETSNTPDTSNASICDIDESELEILKSGNAEWVLILAAWRNSHSFRQKEIKNENFKSLDYLQKYKVLLNERNHELLNIDHQILYPTSKNIYQWKMYYEKIITKAEKIAEPWVKEIVTTIKSTQDEDSKLALSLMLIPYLIPNAKQRTKLEIQKSFICYNKNNQIADEDDDDESEHCSKRLKIESPPKINLIGDSNQTISLAYVDICDTQFKFENPMQAIEFCFHCFTTMNMKYPQFSSNVWIFIQKLIFEINTPWETDIPSINTMINDLHLGRFK